MNNDQSLQKIEKVLVKIDEYKSSTHFKQGLLSGIATMTAAFLFTAIVVFSTNKKERIEEERVAAEKLKTEAAEKAAEIAKEAAQQAEKAVKTRKSRKK